MRRYLLLLAILGFSFEANLVAAADHDGWCRHHPRACQERRAAQGDNRRLEGWCARHPRACREYGRPPQHFGRPPPPPVHREPPRRESRGEWCQRHPGECDNRNPRNHH